jgi:hypothetical protein
MAQPRILMCVFVAALASTARPAAQVDPAAQPVAVLDNVDLMNLMIKPAYEALRQAMAQPPADRKAWAALYQQAARLAEVENLLFFRTRAGEGRQLEWVGRAARARDASAACAAPLPLISNTSDPRSQQSPRPATPVIRRSRVRPR